MLEAQLHFGDQRARVARRGAALLGYSVAGRELIDGGPADEPPAAFDGAVLAPWPGRVRDATWRHDGATQQLPVNEPETGSALHGLVHFADWTAAQSAKAHVRLGYWLHARPGYPFELQLTSEYTLSETGLRCELTATNVGPTAAPFGCGVHPYFGNAATRVDSMALQLSAGSRLLTDERKLPAGLAGVAGTDYDFGTERALDGLRLDTTFTDLARGPDGTSRVRLRTSEGPVEVWADERFRWWQVYTSDAFDPGAPRYRRSLAVEPMTCPPDALNSGDDLIRLAPGETWRGSWGIAAVG